MQCSDRRQWRGVLAAEGAPGDSEQQSGLDNRELNAALVEGSCQSAVASARAGGRARKPEIAIEDCFNVDAAGIGCPVAFQQRRRAC